MNFTLSRLFRNPATSNFFPFPLGLRNSGVQLLSLYFMWLDNVLKSWLTYLCDLVCWTPAEYIVFLEIVHILKTVAPLWPVVSHLLSAKVSPEWRLDLGVGTLKKCPFPLNRGVPSKEVTYKDYVNIFCVSSIEVSQRRSSTVSIESNNRSPALTRRERDRTGRERSYREALPLYRLLSCARLPRFLALNRPHDYLALRGCEQYKLTPGGTPLYSLDQDGVDGGFWPLSVVNSKGYIISCESVNRILPARLIWFARWILYELQVYQSAYQSIYKRECALACILSFVL